MQTGCDCCSGQGAFVSMYASMLEALGFHQHARYLDMVLCFDMTGITITRKHIGWSLLGIL